MPLPTVHPGRMRLQAKCVAGLLVGVLSLGPCLAWAQTPQESSSSAGAGPPPRQKPPALIDPAGPQISLQTSEALFDVAVALNTCGYDVGLGSSEPLRVQIRGEVDDAVAHSPEAQSTREHLCRFISQHRLSDSSHDLAQYVSLALYLTPPPELTPSVELPEMPPDSTQVVEMLPTLRQFAAQIKLHTLWVTHRPQYDAEVNRLHDPLTSMIVATNAYLKMPANTTQGSRFVVVLEPMLAPGQTNARVYGTDYVVVVSPSDEGKIRMEEVRHTYLHYELEPLLYARATSMDRLLPFLKTVREAPLDYTFRSDIVALVIECMVRAVEARTMDTGVTPYKMPASVSREDVARVEREKHEREAAAEAVRHAAVLRSVSAGYVLTAYFYNRLAAFEHEPQSFKESIGEMVYGMDVPSELSSIKHVEFAEQTDPDIVHRTTRQLHGLDLAELDLISGDVDAAQKLAQTAVAQHTDAARASFLLARCAVLHNDVGQAQLNFEQTVTLSTDPRLLAWSHIYLGRIYDLHDEREKAVAEYQAALNAHDGQVDTAQAAERGLKVAYAPPPGSSKNNGGDPATSDSPE